MTPRWNLNSCPNSGSKVGSTWFHSDTWNLKWNLLPQPFASPLRPRPQAEGSFNAPSSLRPPVEERSFRRHEDLDMSMTSPYGADFRKIFAHRPPISYPVGYRRCSPPGVGRASAYSSCVYADVMNGEAHSITLSNVMHYVVLRNALRKVT